MDKANAKLVQVITDFLGGINESTRPWLVCGITKPN